MRLILFMTRSMSLQAWQENGSLERELALYAALAKRGVRTEIISWGGPEDTKIAAAFPWLRVHINRHRLPQARYERLVPLLHALPLIRADVIKCNQTNGGDLALRCARFWRKPFIARCGYVWSYNTGREVPHALESVLHLEREVFSKCHRAIVTSEAAASRLASVHGIAPDTFACIPNYVPDAFYAAPLSDAGNPPPAIITYVGRLAPEKNLFALLDACAGLDVTVRLIGDGEEREALAAHAREIGVTVEFKGNVPHGTLPALLAESAICVLVSHYEGHPKALIEYMACGRPVLAANAPGINTVIRDDVSGILRATDAASIHAGLKKLLADPALRTRLGRQAREEAGRYSLKRVVEEERKIYASFPCAPVSQKWATALRALAGYGRRKCRRLLAGRMIQFLSKYVDKGPEEANHVLDLMDNQLAGRGPETIRALLGAVDDRFFLPLSDDHAGALMEERIGKRIAGKAPANALRALFALDAYLYEKQGRLAVAYDGGIHTKHRHTKYHDFFVRRLQKNERVLDVGCGIGALAYDMAEAGALVTGIDISEANILTARERFAHPGVTYVCGDALTDLPDGAYETIVLSNVLEHLPERPAFLRSLQARLHPGRYLIRVPLFERDWRVPLKKELGMEWRLDPTHETEYSHESFICELGRAGLFVTSQETRWGEIWCEATSRVDHTDAAGRDNPVTVLMASHNDEAYIADAVNSILRQTMRRFDLLIIDDASTDGTAAILQEFAEKDARIRLMTNERNIGLTASLNRGLATIRTPYIARMDADDIALPQRLECQLAYLYAHPQVAAVGCAVSTFIEEAPDAPPELWYPPAAFDAVRRESLRIGPQLSHPGSMLRADAVKAVGGYREQFKVAQDYDLWLRLLEKYELGNTLNVLLLYRQHQKTVSCARVREQTVNHILALQSSEYRRQGKPDPVAGKELTLDLLEHLLDPAQYSCYAWIFFLTYREIDNKAVLIFNAVAKVLHHATAIGRENNNILLKNVLNAYTCDRIYEIFIAAPELNDKENYHDVFEYIKYVRSVFDTAY